MDAVSLAIGIAALYTTCRDCYSFFTTVKTAEEDSTIHLRELEIQQSILKAWGAHWQIQDQGEGGTEFSDRIRGKRTKLHKYLLSNRFKAEGVFTTLSALADTLSNQEKLIKRYGIQFRSSLAIHEEAQSSSNAQLTILNTTIDDVDPVIREVKSRLSILNKFKWALKDRDHFKKLIADLRYHSDSLYRLCPENAFESMNIYLAMECLARQQTPAGLKSTSRLANEQAEVDVNSSVREGYKLLASAAALKASVNTNRDATQSEHRTLTSVDEEQQEMHYLGKGLALYEGQVVYVEMRDYRGPPLEPTPEQRQQMKERRYSDSDSDEDDKPIELVRPADPELRTLIRNFFSTFQGASMRESVYGLDIAGMIDHQEGEHKGHCSILYRLPGTIGLQTRTRPAENLKLRAPVTLKSLLGNKYQPGIRSPLGARFDLARKLVRAVCLLHSSGWLHKNIRAESVMFFPEHVKALEEDRYEVKTQIDVSNPILMGYIFSRPDDVILQTSTQALEAEQGIQERTTTVHSKSLRSRFEPSWETSRGDESQQRGAAAPRYNSIYGRDMLGTLKGLERTKDTNVSGFTLDYYQHPAKHADPMRLYRHAYDVYSLGILLLEIGLWEKLKRYEDSRHGHETTYEEEDHYERRRWICRKYLDRLRWECGDAYADVVLSCLMLDSSNDEVAMASERELCARIVADLEGCQA